MNLNNSADSIKEKLHAWNINLGLSLGNKSTVPAIMYLCIKMLFLHNVPNKYEIRNCVFDKRLLFFFYGITHFNINLNLKFSN